MFTVLGVRYRESQSNAIKATSKGMRRTEKICLSPPHMNVRRKEIVPKINRQAHVIKNIKIGLLGVA